MMNVFLGCKFSRFLIVLVELADIIMYEKWFLSFYEQKAKDPFDPK